MTGMYVSPFWRVPSLRIYSKPVLPAPSLFLISTSRFGFLPQKAGDGGGEHRAGFLQLAARPSAASRSTASPASPPYSRRRAHRARRTPHAVELSHNVCALRELFLGLVERTAKGSPFFAGVSRYFDTHTHTPINQSLLTLLPKYIQESTHTAGPTSASDRGLLTKPGPWFPTPGMTKVLSCGSWLFKVHLLFPRVLGSDLPESCSKLMVHLGSTWTLQSTHVQSRV